MAWVEAIGTVIVDRQSAEAGYRTEVQLCIVVDISGLELAGYGVAIFGGCSGGINTVGRFIISG